MLLERISPTLTFLCVFARMGDSGLIRSMH
jgi:hypothetical protein